jgi:hypothetical protein
MCVFSSWGIDKSDGMWLMESVTKEVRNACTTPSWQPPARAICPLEATSDWTTRSASSESAILGWPPRGLAPWKVQGKVRDRLIRERALVEGSIGTIKCPKYGFNRPAARSAAMMGACGQRAVLGLNLTKLLRGAAGKRGIALAV